LAKKQAIEMKAVESLKKIEQLARFPLEVDRKGTAI
jgi:hypothetical protein